MSAVHPSLRSYAKSQPLTTSARKRNCMGTHRLCLIGAWMTLTGLAAWPCVMQAQSPAPPQTPAPAKPADPNAPTVATNSKADLEYAARVAMAQGVMILKQFAEKDPMGWIIPPVQKVRVTGYKDVPRKYRIIEVERATYEYTDVVVFIPSGSPGEPPTKTIRKQPTKQIGTHTEKYIRWDPEGPLEMIDKQPIYEHVGDTSWQFSLIGDSAMALDALRNAGVPEGDSVIQHMLDNLNTYLETYGPPDQTWNLAWLTIAMAKTEGEIAEKWTEKLASRILDGQITDGAARGLWGPMSVHPRLISILVRDYLAAEGEFSKRQAKAKEKPTKANQALVDEADADRNRLRKYTDSWTRLALRFAMAEIPHVWDDQMAEKVQFMGSTDYFYNQRSADVESTWVALHALAVCAETKRLPKDSIRPTIPAAYRETSRKLGEAAKAPTTVISQVNAETVPPEASMAVLARAANALVALQPENGEWHECNFHQPVTDFDAFGQFLSVPAVPASFVKLPTPTTAISAAQGIACLDCIGRAVGMEKLEKLVPKYLAGARGRASAQQCFIKTTWPKREQRPAVMKAEVCDLLLAAARPLQMSVAETSAEPVDDQLTRLLILSGDPDGGWGSRFRRVYLPSSSRARYETLKYLPGQNWKSWKLNVPVDFPKAHVNFYNVYPSDFNVSSGVPFATAAAVHYLAARVKDPGGTLQQLCADPKLADQRKGLDALMLTPVKPKPAPVVAAKPAAPAKATAAAKPAPKPEEVIPAITIKPADTTKKKDESF